MSAFLFQAKTGDGKVVKGEVDAGSESEARVKIRAQKLVPLKVVPKNAAAARPAPKAKRGSGGSVAAKELQIFTRQFAVLINSGVPIVQSLEAMVGPGRSPVMNSCLKALIEDVGQGRRLAEAMRLHPNVFDSMYVNLVNAGEEGGVLDTVLNRLAAYIEKSVKLKAKLKGAMFYPIAVIAVSILVISGILWFVIPKFVEIFSNANMQLPWLTQQVINASNFFKHYWYIFIGIFSMTPVAFKQYYATEDGRRTIDAILIEIPVMGDLVKKGAIARFTRTLSTMLTAGVRIVEALDIAVSTTQQYVLEQVLISCKDSINKGRSLSEPVKKSKYIPDMVGQMISVGEQTGALDTMLDKVANFYEEEVEQATDAMTSVIEPIMMVVLGGIIAVLVIAMYLPIFSMAGAAGG
jgi:type IV pilus assembly protein PilC